MELGIEQNALTMYALERQQALISHNLACSGTHGYQEKVAGFVGKKNGAIEFEQLKPLESLTPNLQLKINEQMGALERTQVPTDVALNGQGFFKVQTPNGQYVFTRHGSFHFDGTGCLSDALGRQVVGDSGPIQAENNGDPIFINQSGQIFEGDQQIGTLAAFILPEKMQQNPSAQYTDKDLMGVTTATSTHFESGFLERSNVSPLREMVQMIQTSHMHEANRSLIKQWDEVLGESLQTLGNTNG